MMPQIIMEQFEWECPVCQKICSCGSCRRKTNNIPYEPRGTVLGHDTRKFADPRSVESLVDFSMSNLHHIKKTGDEDPLDSRRMGRRMDEAAEARSRDPELGENYVEDEEPPVREQFYENGIRYITEPDIPIDPTLSLQQAAVPILDAQKAKTGHKTYRRLDEDERDGDYGRRQRKKKPSEKQATGKGRRSSAGHAMTNTPPGSGAPTPTSIAPMANMHQSGQEHDPGQLQRHHTSPSTGTSISTLPNNAVGNIRVNGEQTNNGSTLLSEDLSEFQQARLGRSLQEARRNDRYITAEAAMTGKSLKVVLKAGRLGLALLADRIAAQSPGSLGARNVETELLRSDLPPVQQPVKPGNAAKKRKALDSEPDGDFSTRKKKDRKTETLQAPDFEQDPDSEAEGLDYSDTSDAAELFSSSVTKPRGPRKLPKYLADQHEDGDMPAELPQEAPRRRPSQVKKPGIVHRTPALSQRRDTKGGAATIQGDKTVQENLRAKQKAVQWADGGHIGSESDGEANTETLPQSGLSRAKDALLKVPQSMFSRMGGKKFKVAGAKTKK